MERIIIIGGGVIGLSIGWQLVKAGCEVIIFEKERSGRGASWQAAGLLSPIAEAKYVERVLLELGIKSLRLYPEFVAELEKDCGQNVDFRSEGTLILALNRDDYENLKHIYETQKIFQLNTRWMSGEEAREREPLLSLRVNTAIWGEEDVQIDNRKMVDGLRTAFLNQGGKLNENKGVKGIDIKNGKVKSVKLQNGEQIEGTKFVLAAGCWSAQIQGIPEKWIPPVRPVRGQIIALKMEAPNILNKVLYAPHAYLAPKSDGRLMIGATMEEMGFDTCNTAGGIRDLLQGAWEAVPGVAEMQIMEISAGLRPGSRDNAPVLGETEIENFYLATGHFRKGILLAPVTAREMVKIILNGTKSEILEPFRMIRFIHG